MKISSLTQKQIPKKFCSVLSGIVYAALIITSCSDQIVSECDENILIVNSTFSDIQDKVFNISCAVSGCHISQMHESGMNLSKGAAYDNLVNVVSRGDPQLKRVEPGNSQQSYLIRKLTGSNTSVMPPTGKLSDAVIDSIAAWIDKGALP